MCVSLQIAIGSWVNGIRFHYGISMMQYYCSSATAVPLRYPKRMPGFSIGIPVASLAIVLIGAIRIGFWVEHCKNKWIHKWIHKLFKLNKILSFESFERLNFQSANSPTWNLRRQVQPDLLKSLKILLRKLILRTSYSKIHIVNDLGAGFDMLWWKSCVRVGRSTSSSLV